MVIFGQEFVGRKEKKNQQKSKDKLHMISQRHLFVKKMICNSHANIFIKRMV